MKHLDRVSTSVRCFDCKKSGFFISTPNGAHDVECPLCPNYVPNIDLIEIKSTINKIEGHDNSFGLIHFLYCDKCRIVFDLGTTHLLQGCTESIYNTIFISEYIYKGKTYVGMPQFDNTSEMSQIIVTKIKEMYSEKCIY